MLLHPYCGFLKDAPFAVVICGRPDLQKKICEGYWPQDCAAAAENLLIQAVGLGYGACWCGIYPVEDRVKGFQEVLNVTSIPFALITTGLAGEAPALRGYYDETRVKVR